MIVGMQATADMAVRKEATPQDASSFLAMVFEKTGQHLDIFQSLSDFVEGVKTHQGAPPSRTCRVAPLDPCLMHITAFDLPHIWEELRNEGVCFCAQIGSCRRQSVGASRSSACK